MPAKKATEETTENTQLQKNVRFYHKFMTTPKDAQRSFNNGSFSGTDINPMWRIKILTEVFGPCGFGWWTQNVHYEFVESEETKETSVFCELELVVKDPDTGEVSQPIYGIGGNTYIKNWGQKGIKASDEAKKMAYTDAMSIACKALGIGHDIWYSNDRTKYTMMNDDAPVNEPKKPEPKAEQKLAEHTVDSATLISEIEQQLAVIGKDMDNATKLDFAKKTILPIIGSMNYKSCTEVDKLITLRDKLKVA